MLDTNTRNLSLFSRLCILFGGSMSLFSWIFLGFGMIFVWGFVMNSTIKHVFSPSLDKEVTGIVKDIKGTNSSIDEDPVMEYIYTYTIDGEEYYGHSYSHNKEFTQGQTVNVEYSTTKPESSQIKGTLREMFSGWVAFVLLFPLFGLIGVVYTLIKNNKALSLISSGAIAWGTLKKKKATNASVDDETVYKYTFVFEAKDGKEYKVKGSTHKTGLLEDDGRERILYSPENPNKAVLYDLVSQAPKMAANGDVEQVSFKYIYVILVPLIVLLGHGIYIFYKYFS